MLRWAFNIAAALSMVLLLVILVLWVCSQTLFWHDGRLEAMYGRRVWITFVRPDGIACLGMKDVPEVIVGDRERGLIRIPGFVYHHELLTNGVIGSVDQYLVHLDYWFAAAIFAITSAPCFMVLLPRKVKVARLRGRCSCCGYDLRATPNRCPECGHVPQKVTA